MNRALWFYGIKKLVPITCLVLILMTLYVTIIVQFYDPGQQSALTEITKSIPMFRSILGMEDLDLSLKGHLIQYLYGFLLLALPLIASLTSVHQLFGYQIDNGNLSIWLSSNLSRKKIWFTFTLVVMVILLVLMGYLSFIEILSVHLFDKGQLVLSEVLELNMGLWALHVMIASWAIMMSVFGAKTSLSLGVGLILCMLVFKMLASQAEWLSYLSIFCAFDPKQSLYAVFLLIPSLICLVISCFIFSRKDYSI